jgi:hypothetical protein
MVKEAFKYLEIKSVYVETLHTLNSTTPLPDPSLKEQIVAPLQANASLQESLERIALLVKTVNNLSASGGKVDLGNFFNGEGRWKAYKA